MGSKKRDEQPSSKGKRQPGTITVEGRASRWVTADFAEVSFTVSRRAKTSGAAVADASEIYNQLDQILGQHAEVITRRTTTSLSVHPVVRYDPETNREVREGFDAVRTQTVRFSPVSGAGAALRSVLVRVPGLGVAGPVFGLEPENEAHQLVRADAAAAARSSAQAYADGLGLALGAVLAVREPGTGFGGGGPVPHPMAEMAMLRGKAAGGPEDGPVLVDLTDEDVELQAAVEVVIAIAES